MRAAGWIWLWLLLTVVGVPAAAISQFDARNRVWDNAERSRVQACVEKENSLPNHPDALECMHRLGVDGTFYEKEHTTFVEYWSNNLAVPLAIDLAVTAAIVETTLAIRVVAKSLRAVFAPGRRRVARYAAPSARLRSTTAFRG